jgi:hypothetical protein
MVNLFEKINREFQLWLLEKEEEMKVPVKDHNWHSASLLLYRLRNIAKDPRYVLNDIVRKAVEKKIDVVATPVPEPKRKPGRPFKDEQKADNIVIAASTDEDRTEKIHEVLKRTFGQ